MSTSNSPTDDSPITQWLEQPLLNHPLSNALLSAIPIAGGPLQILLSAEITKLRERKWQKFASMVEERLGKVESQSIDLQELRSENFLNLFQRGASEVTERADEEKLKYLRDYLIRCAWQNGPDTTLKEVFFSYLQRCTGTHLRILEIFYSIQGNLSSADRFRIPNPTEVAPVDETRLKLQLVSTFDTALLKMVTNDLEFMGLIHPWNSNNREKGWSLSDVGIAFFSFLKFDKQFP